MSLSERSKPGGGGQGIAALRSQRQNGATLKGRTTDTTGGDEPRPYGIGSRPEPRLRIDVVARFISASWAGAMGGDEPHPHGAG